MSGQTGQPTDQDIEGLKKAIREEEQTRSVLKRAVFLLQNKTTRRKQKQDQLKIEQLRNSINDTN